MGSALVGDRELITRARRFKQMFGGGFRQAGMMAAAARYAVQNHRDRLAEDHETASRLAAGLSEMPEIAIDPAAVQTNMVYFSVDDATAVCHRLAERDVLMLAVGVDRIRAVTHLGIDSADVDHALQAITEVVTS